MIAYLHGTLTEKSPTQVVLDVHGVGYEVLIPVSTFEQLAETGSQVKLLTYQHVREDILQLFGFANPKEKWMFQKLISVSGVGPKLALAMISGCRVDDLSTFISNGDIDRLTKLPGVGKKTAQRLSLELRDKLGAVLDPQAVIGPSAQIHRSGKMEEGVLALVSLGLSRGDAERSLAKIAKDDPELPLDEMIRRSLQRS